MSSPDRRPVVESIYFATLATLFLAFLAWLGRLAGCGR